MAGWMSGREGATDGNVAETVAGQVVEDAITRIEQMPAEQRDAMMREARATVRGKQRPEG